VPSQDKFYSATSEGEALLIAKELKAEEKRGSSDLAPSGEVSQMPDNSNILSNSTVSYFLTLLLGAFARIL
jgi:hypothetical protein